MSRELDEFLRRQEQAPQAAAQARINAGRQQQPAQAAEIAKASRTIGVPTDVVSAAPDVYREQASNLEDNLALSRSAPLAQWLAQNETNAPVARGAFSGLADMQANIAKHGARANNPTDRAREALAGLGVGGGAGYEIFNFVKNTIGAVTSGDVTTSKIGSALLSGTAGAGTGIAGLGEATMRTVDKYSPVAMAERALFGQSLEGMAADRAQSQSRKWDKVAQYLHPETQTEEGAGVISGFESLPLSVAGLLGGAYFRSTKIATGAISAVVGGQSYRTGIDAGLSNERAILFGGADALIEYATEILPTGTILKSVGGKGKLAKNLADLLITEIPGEQLATLGQDFNQWFSIDANKGKTFGAYLAERPAAAKQTLLATLVGAGTVTSAVSATEYAAAKLGRELPRALPAEENARFLDALGRLSAANEVLKRDKGTFEDWVRTASEDTAATDVFIDAEQIAKVFDQGNIDPELAFAITGMSPEQLQQAVQRGDTLSIPIEKYASTIAPSAVSAQLIPHLRISPEDMSIEEAKVFLQGAKDEFAKDVEETFAKSQQEDALRASHDAVRDNVAAQIKATGRFNAGVTDTYAGLTAAFYTSLGGKLGLTAEETATRYPLRIQSGEVAQPTFDQQGGSATRRVRVGDLIKYAEHQAGLDGVEIDPARQAESDNIRSYINEKKAIPGGRLILEIDTKRGTAQLRDGNHRVVLGNQIDPDLMADVEIRRRETKRPHSLGTQYGGEFDQPQGKPTATLDDFAPGNIGSVMSKGNWAVLTAANPMGETAPDDVNAAANLLLEADLQARGLEYTPSIGKYGQMEPGFVVTGIDEATATELGKKYMQHSVLTPAGLVYHDGSINPATGEVDEFSERPDDFFTEIPSLGTNFKIGIDFDTTIKAEDRVFNQDRRQLNTKGGITGVDLTNSLAQAAELARSSRFPTGRAFKEALQARALAAQKAQGINLGDLTDENVARLADFIFEDALEAVQDNANAIGWYDRAVTEAKAELSKLYPEILTDAQSEFAFIWALAVTSNGLKVDKNFELAAKAYETWKATGAFPTNIGIGQAAKAINESLALYSVLVDQLGSWETARDFMVQESKVSAIEKSAGIKISGESKNQVVRGAAVLGPKIGNGFFSNLYGFFDGLTMDRWLIRSVGRWRGTLIGRSPAMEAQKRKEIAAHLAALSQGERKALAELLKATDAQKKKGKTDISLAGRVSAAGVDALANEVAKRSMKPEWRTAINALPGGEGLRLLGNALAKYLDGQVEAPKNAGERIFLRKAFTSALERLRAEPGMDALTMADLQALLWYPEKLLYESAKKKAGEEVRGYEDDEAPDYANAARKLVRDRLRSAGGGQSSAERSGFGGQPEGARVLDQSPLENPLDAFRRESFYPTRATRLEDGTILADVPNWYPDRLAKLAEKFGAPKVEGVEKDDPRLDTGVPLWFTAPPIEADGMIRLDHWGPSGVATTDPEMWGAGGTLPPSERAQVGKALPRTYFGIASGLPGGYVIEFPTSTQYEARVDPASLYDIARDPDKLKQGDGVNALERRIKAAGYLGYWSNNDQLGLVATVFDPLPVKPASAQVLNQDAVFYSALERAVENSTTKKAPAAQWIATLQKTPGVKQEELEWTGLLDFLADVEGPVTREAILELVRSGGIRTDEVVLGGKTDFREEGIARIMADLPGTSRADAAEMWDEDPSQQFEYSEARGEPQFSSWTTDPNNDSYRELLITLPLGQGGNPNRAASTHWDIDGVVAHARFMDKTDADGKKVLFVEEVQSDWHQKGRDQGYQQKVDPAVVAAAEAKQTAAAVKLNDITNALGLQMQAQYDAFLASAFENGGEKLRAQQEDDYGHLAPRDGEISISKAARFLREFPVLDLVDMDTVREFEVARLRYNEAVQEQSRASNTQGIPNAPFKTTWPALVMKRMIRYAAEHGYERIAWTTGKQQSERYNLGTAVGTIQRMGAKDGQYFLRFGSSGVTNTLIDNGLAKDSPDNFDEVVMTEEQLKQAFGGDVAQQIVDDPSGQPLSGEGLNVGGEGMRAFYDRNLINITNGLIKKHGAKVGMSLVQGVNGTNAQTRSAIEGEIQRAVGLTGYGLTTVSEAEARIAELESSKREGSGQAAEKLRAVLPLIAELEGTPKGEAQPGFDITPSLADAAMGGQPLFQKTGAPRGQIAFAPDITKTPSVITVLRGADLSTFVHELGHFFFEVTNHVASQAGAPQQLVDDRDAMLRYLGITSVSEWENMTPEARRDGHERMARSFEAYLFEGKAPSIELRGIFSRLRGWMMNVYRTITRLNVSLTDEVRSAFDRMLASEEQIRDTEADSAMAPQFAEKPEGMSDADWGDYQQLGTDATAEASEALARRSLRDMQHAGRSVAREIKRLQAEMKERRDAMREEVEAEISAKPIYQAITFLRKGTIGESQPEEFHKLDTTIVREVLQLDPDMPLPDALKGMTSTKDGVNPEQVAELFGYSSADHLIKDLLFASPMKEAIEAETDARMRERYGEVAHPDQLDEAARAAVHNDVRGRFVATELAALQKAPGKKRVLDGAARRLAGEMIARLRIRDLRPGQYENAERKAAKAAQKAGTANLDEAVRQKRNQLFQFHAAKAAHEAIEETRKARDYLSKFGNKNTRAALDPTYLDQIDQLLERFELRQISNREADRRKSLADWIKSQEDMGFEPTLDPEFLDEVGRKPWRDLTVEEMRELVDGIKNIEFIARRSKELLTAIDKAKLDDAANEVAESIRTNALSSRDEIVGNKTWLEAVKNGVRDFFAMHRKMANLLYVFDGNTLGGPSWERFMRGANRAGDAETQALRDAGSVLEPLFRQLGNTLRREYIPEIERSLNLQDRLMIALNWGNATNRARVMDGDKWTPEQVEAILAPLTPAHWDFVEAVWAHINSYRQQIIDKEVRVSGVEPKMVEAEPFQVANPDGTLRLITGGYFPIKYDPDRSSKAEADTAADIAKQMQRGLYTRATTRRGHLKERVDSVADRPIRKDFGVIFEHNSQVIHDLAWHEYLIDANRLLRHGAVDSAIREHYGPETLRWLRKALEDMATGDVPAQNALERGVNYLRSGATVAGLGWNLFTSLLQPVGLTQSWSRIGGKWVGKGIGELLGNPAKMNEKVQWIYSVSPFMRARGDTMQREINEIRNTLAAKGPVRSALDKVISPDINDAIGDSFFVLIAKAQLMADLPTWLGQYHKSLEGGQTEERAIELANQSVIDSQGSGMIKDLAGVQKGAPIWKLWTNFYSYFSVTYNLLADRTTEMRRVGPKDLPYYAVDVLMLTAVPATITAIMRAVLKGEEPDEPEDWLALLAKENLSYLLGLMLGIREVGAALTGEAGYRGPAGARVIGDLSNLGKQAAQGEADAAAFRAANNVAGVLLHYPAGQVDRTARGLYYLSKGEAGVMAPVVGPPKDAGQ